MGNFRCRSLEKHRDYKREHAGVLRSAAQGVTRVQVTSKINPSTTAVAVSRITQSKPKVAQSRKDKGQNAQAQQGRLSKMYYSIFVFWQTKFARPKTAGRITSQQNACV